MSKANSVISVSEARLYLVYRLRLGVVAPCYQHHHNKVPQLHTTQSEPLV